MRAAAAVRSIYDDMSAAHSLPCDAVCRQAESQDLFEHQRKVAVMERDVAGL